MECHPVIALKRADLNIATDYVHGPRITGGELLVLKHKARSLNCPNSHWCQNINCYMGKSQGYNPSMLETHDNIMRYRLTCTLPKS